MPFTRNPRGKAPIRPSPASIVRARWIASAARAVAGVATAVPLLLAALGASAPGPGTPPGPAGVRTVTQDLRGATFDVTPYAARFDTTSVAGTVYSRVKMPGAVVVETPGRPALPTIEVRVAIPDGMSPRLRVAAEQWDDRSAPPPIPVTRETFVSDEPKTGPVSEYRTEPDPTIYRGAALYPTDAAVFGSGAMVGQWWVAPIYVHPVRWDPRSGAYRVLRTMSLRVDFVPATDQEMKLRPAPRPGAQARLWDRVQRNLVRNYDAARAFAIRPRPGALGAAPIGGSGSRTRSTLATTSEWKLAVTQTGWVSVSYATLAASGFPSGEPIANVRVEERGYDDVGDIATVTPIPVVARDVGVTGTFDAGDAITFYARGVRDRFGAGNLELRYTDTNVYWLSVGASTAPVPGLVDGTITGGGTVPASFQDVMRLEQNLYAFTTPTTTGASPPEAIDHIFWTNGFDPDLFDQAITFPDPDATQPFRIRSRYVGKLGSVHRLSIFFQGAGNAIDTLAYQDVFLDQSIYFLDTGFTIPGALLATGSGHYQHVGEKQNALGGWGQGSSAMLDVIEATYSRLYKARGNVLRFTSGSTAGVVEPHVTGFTSSAIEVYDVTDPLAPLRVTGATVGPSGGGFAVSFQTDASGGPRTFVALAVGSETALGTGAVTADTPSDLRTPGTFGAGSVGRAIIIAPAAFLTPATRLADYRRSQGYVVEVASIEDVYDEFNGGLKSARAIRRYARHAFLSWTPAPEFLVLAGDGSLDYRHDLATSAVDWIPTYLRFEHIPGPSGYELVANDSYYAINLANADAGTGDFLPSLSLGRIPARSAADLDQYVSKVIRYETFAPSDTWRGRQLLFSDDEYSTTITFNQGYCFQPQETEFLAASQDYADTTGAGTGGVDLQNDFFDLHTYTDPVPAPGGCRSLTAVKSQLSSFGGYDSLIAAIDRGGLVFNLETHANRYLVAHEDVLCSENTLQCPDPNSPDKVGNFGKPYFFMVWGCHASAFSDAVNTGSNTTDSTQAINEVWTMMPDQGAIASYGSSGYEYLQTNAVYNAEVGRALYLTPPSPDPAPGAPRQARWIVGEVILEAAVRMAPYSYFLAAMNQTSAILGDPMVHMDALAPRIFQVTLDGAAFPDNDPLTVDSPTDSLVIVASMRDEVGIASASVAERDLASGTITPLDSTLFAVTFSDSSRVASLTGKVRPHLGNYDLQVRASDVNGRLRVFTMQVRTPIKFYANGTEILNNVFVESNALLRADVVSPIPLTADSLELWLDGVPISSSKTATDGTGRKWTLESLSGNRSEGPHTIQVAFNGRTAGFDQRTFQITSRFTLRGVAVVDTRMVASGCGGSVFQYELSAAARDVRLAVYTVAGRRVASIDLPGQAGFNVYCWNGRDSQGHEAAIGLYLFRIQATDTGGRTQTRQGRFIRSR
ncbi:MAG TPA: C25 family cysteine peptidase [Candidatus Eisenbacteria bacterium]